MRRRPRQAGRGTEAHPTSHELAHCSVQLADGLGHHTDNSAPNWRHATAASGQGGKLNVRANDCRGWGGAESEGRDGQRQRVRLTELGLSEALELSCAAPPTPSPPLASSTTATGRGDIAQYRGEMRQRHRCGAVRGWLSARASATWVRETLPDAPALQQPKAELLQPRG